MAKKTVIVRLFDEVNCLVTGLHPSDNEVLYNKWGFLTQDYFFNPKFKLGKWDGKIRYFGKTGKTYVRLLDEIVPHIVSMGYNVKIDDKRQSLIYEFDKIDRDYFSHIIDSDGEPIILGEHQVDAVNSALEYKEGIIEAGTGAGKTICMQAMASVFNTKGLRTLIIVPSSDLVIQTKQSFSNFDIDVGEYSGKKKDINHLNVISTWQALQNNTEIVSTFQVVIVDEAHSAKAKILTELLAVHGKNIVYRFGLTGTIPKHKTDELTIKAVLGSPIYKIPAIDLINKGWLSNLHIEILQLKEHDVQRDYFPDYTSEKDFLNKNITRSAWVADYLDIIRLKQGNVFALVDSIALGKKLHEFCPNSIFLHGEDSSTVRKQFYDLFESNNDLVVIATYGIASTGLSIDRIFNLFLIDSGKSFTRVIQSIGRGLRKAEDKTEVKVYDICSDLKYSKSHLSHRIKYYKEANYPFTKKIIKYRE